MKKTEVKGACANCNSTNIEYGGTELHDEQMSYDYTCNDCGEPGKEWYTLEYIETIKY